MPIVRCAWASKITDPEYLEYHDLEWSVPITDDVALFELLCLEGAQSGLSWITILKKREMYRKHFCRFDFRKIAQMKETAVGDILAKGGVVRHLGKIKSVFDNAKAVLKLLTEFPSLHAYFQTVLVGVDVRDPGITQTPVSEASVRVSKDLKKRGFNFVGPTTMQAFLQASGLFQAHDRGCFKCPKKSR